MGKPPDKRPPAASGPMTLGSMRSLGPRSLDVTCNACGYRTTANVDSYPDDMPVLSFCPRMRCRKCGHLGANVRPDWSQLRKAPGTPQQ
jgi:ribosomal protein L37E